MKLYDRETTDIASSVSKVLEAKTAKKEEIKYPHKMYHPKSGEAVSVKNEEEHEEYAKKGYLHDKPEVNEVEEPRAKGEKDFKDKHVVKKSGEKEDGTVMKEAKKKAEKVEVEVEVDDEEDEEEDEKEESSEKTPKQKQEDAKAKYKKFFDAALKKFGVNSPAELEGEKKKEFFDYVDKHYDAENEKD